MKKLAVIGSSGGNLFYLGGNQPLNLLEELDQQCKQNGCCLTAVQYIGAEESLDQNKSEIRAALYTLKNGQIIVGNHARLEHINKEAKCSDEEIAKNIRNGQIDGLILISADPLGVNSSAVKAAIEKMIPIVGTGGTSMAWVESIGGHVVGSSGTTGTTNRTRARTLISYLCSYWKMRTQSAHIQWKNLKLTGILTAGLPAFIALSIVYAVAEHFPIYETSQLLQLAIMCIPVLLAMFSAKQISDLNEVTLIAALLAGLFASSSGVLGGIVAGLAAGVFAQYLLDICIRWKVPITTSNLIAGALSGLIPGTIINLVFAPFLSLVQNGLVQFIEMIVNWNGWLVGALSGMLIWLSLLKKGYHALILPLILIEIAQTGTSFFGAIDLICLVAIAAGVNAAIFVTIQPDRIAAKKGLVMNVCYGTFVESIYPYFKNKAILISTVISAGFSGMLVGWLNLRGVAYVPFVLAPFLSNSMVKVLLVMVMAMVFSFICVLIIVQVEKSAHIDD
ncbi:PTS sugar transporter [Sporolactobacillus shoreicorticis]|uniref:PTS sugar transporter n=1 Tax=Sporolactobacillus shoreicorticis TaxID=1923877 RepID=A0ABW5S0U7_9BACL|nr:PTS sugar transporter [Sporolactobacillus shoreicorticis]MCO7125279.1 PTS sugar transporter [Sporolactobacillus shoreicorticis]